MPAMTIEERTRYIKHLIRTLIKLKMLLVMFRFLHDKEQRQFFSVQPHRDLIMQILQDMIKNLSTLKNTDKLKILEIYQDIQQIMQAVSEKLKQLRPQTYKGFDQTNMPRLYEEMSLQLEKSGNTLLSCFQTNDETTFRISELDSLLSSSQNFLDVISVNIKNLCLKAFREIESNKSFTLISRNSSLSQLGKEALLEVEKILNDKSLSSEEGEVAAQLTAIWKTCTYEVRRFCKVLFFDSVEIVAKPYVDSTAAARELIELVTVARLQFGMLNLSNQFKFNFDENALKDFGLETKVLDIIRPYSELKNELISNNNSGSISRKHETKGESLFGEFFRRNGFIYEANNKLFGLMDEMIAEGAFKDKLLEELQELMLELPREEGASLKVNPSLRQTSITELDVVAWYFATVKIVNRALHLLSIKDLKVNDAKEEKLFLESFKMLAFRLAMVALDVRGDARATMQAALIRLGKLLQQRYFKKDFFHKIFGQEKIVQDLTASLSSNMGVPVQAINSPNKFENQISSYEKLLNQLASPIKMEDTGTAETLPDQPYQSDNNSANLNKSTPDRFVNKKSIQQPPNMNSSIFAATLNSGKNSIFAATLATTQPMPQSRAEPQLQPIEPKTPARKSLLVSFNNNNNTMEIDKLGNNHKFEDEAESVPLTLEDLTVSQKKQEQLKQLQAEFCSQSVSQGGSVSVKTIKKTEENLNTTNKLENSIFQSSILDDAISDQETTAENNGEDEQKGLTENTNNASLYNG